LNYLEKKEESIFLNIYVQPNASRTAIVGLHDRSLKIALQAPPIDGEANKAAVEFFSLLFSLPKKSLTLVKGEKSRLKRIQIQGADYLAIKQILEEKLK
jgi:uncharacterized protein